MSLSFVIVRQRVETFLFFFQCVYLCLSISMYISLLHSAHQSTSTWSQMHQRIRAVSRLPHNGVAFDSARRVVSPFLVVTVVMEPHWIFTFQSKAKLQNAEPWRRREVGTIPEDALRCLFFWTSLQLFALFLQHPRKWRTEGHASLLCSVRGDSFGTRSGQPPSPGAVSPERPSRPLL